MKCVQYIVSFVIIWLTARTVFKLFKLLLNADRCCWSLIHRFRP